MHINFDADSHVDWMAVFDSQTLQHGSGGFRGYQYQRGASGLGGLLSKLFSLVLPLAKQATRVIGAEALEASGRVVDDLSSGRSLGDSLREQGPRAYKNLVSKAVQRLNQTGGSRKGSKRKRKPAKKPKKKRVIRKRKTVKKKKKPAKKPAKAKKTVKEDIFGRWAS